MSVQEQPGEISPGRYEAEILSHIIRNRRSIYANAFTGRPIPESLLREILTDATWAPTHKMTQPWHFVVLRGSELSAFGKFMAEYYREDYPERYKDLMHYPENAACAIVLLMERNPEKNLPEWEEIAAVSCAVQNMWLSCHARGIGAYWDSCTACIEYGQGYTKSGNDSCLGFFYMGCYDETGKPPRRRRKPLETKITWIGQDL